MRGVEFRASKSRFFAVIIVCGCCKRTPTESPSSRRFIPSIFPIKPPSIIIAVLVELNACTGSKPKSGGSDACYYIRSIMSPATLPAVLLCPLVLNPESPGPSKSCTATFGT
jgi:hypothetical protein